MEFLNTTQDGYNMAIPVTLLWTAPNTTFVAPLQTLAAAGPLVLNGPVGVSIPNFARTITLTSGFNNSAVNFVIVGKDIYGNVIQETLGGPNANTVESVNSYNFVSSITTSAAITATSAGTGTGGESIWVQLNNFSVSFQISLNIFVTGTVSYSAFRTASPFNTLPFLPPYSAPIAPSITGATTSQYYYTAMPSTGVQFVFAKNAANTGTAAIVILQQGIV